MPMPSANGAPGGGGQAGVVRAGFIADAPPTRSSHASTILETEDGLLTAWFGGEEERAPDVGIWVSRHDGASWSAPVEVANGVVAEDQRRYPCWNPVLFRARNGPLLLFYKVGPSPSKWWGMVMTSWDRGRNWEAARRLPRGIFGPIRNKPIELPDGTILCGSSVEDTGWQVHLERTRDEARTWSRTPALHNAMEFGAIQPTLLAHRGGRMQMLCRTKQSRVAQSWSEDGGLTWSPLERSLLPNPNSALDAVRLKDGRSLLVYNHATEGRGLLNVAVSRDNGEFWHAAAVLENEPGAEFSYPAVIQAQDGLVHVTYTWKRLKIKHAVLDPAQFDLRFMPTGQWPE
jgi:predicted neuraminidase